MRHMCNEQSCVVNVVNESQVEVSNNRVHTLERLS